MSHLIIILWYINRTRIDKGEKLLKFIVVFT